MSRNYKNILKSGWVKYGRAERQALQHEVLKDSTPFPGPVGYQDIDEAFRDWVENELKFSVEGEVVPTVALFTNQRFSEYMQSWENVDEKKNLMLNFKTITRENNPKSGTINGNTKNIPGRRTYLMKRVVAFDKDNRKYFIDYRMRQPMGIDLIYTVNIVTNRYVVLNDFNTMVNDKFSSITAYIRPKGHFMSMTLNDIGDESEYQIDDRQYYSQSFNIKVRAYIIQDSDYIVEEKPRVIVMGFDERKERSYAEIEELPCDDDKQPYYKQGLLLTIHIGECSDKVRFTLDVPMQVLSAESENMRSVHVVINGEDYDYNDLVNRQFEAGSEFSFSKVSRFRSHDECLLTIHGYDYTSVYTDESTIEYNIEAQ